MQLRSTFHFGIFIWFYVVVVHYLLGLQMAYFHILLKSNTSNIKLPIITFITTFCYLLFLSVTNLTNFNFNNTELLIGNKYYNI